jgi:16S rRNA (cytosine1402-N4)-methyltransferase
MTLLATHIPVLLGETVEGLAVKAGGRYVDCTLGAGGHAGAVLERSQPGGQLLGIEADPTAVISAAENLSRFGSAVLIVNDNFSNLKSICEANDFTPVNGILFDLGMSSMQLSPGGRGFSFQYDAPLDMRFNPGQGLSAADIINSYEESRLANLIYEFGEEERSRQVARAILRARPLSTTGELARVIERVMPGYHRIHPATKTFQALRIAVNDELTRLSSALNQATDILGQGGRLVIISYHSLEDRIVKNFLKLESASCICPPGLPQCVCQQKPRLKLISRGVIIPSESETEANPRARSAKMRVAERISIPEAANSRGGGTAGKKKRNYLNKLVNMN